MNLQEWREFREKTRTGDGAIVATQVVVPKSLIEDAAALSVYLPRAHENAARDFYDRDDCAYTYIPPTELEYSPGPFAFIGKPGDIPENAVQMIGRVRIRGTA
jgi:hypothetical protein